MTIEGLVPLLPVTRLAARGRGNVTVFTSPNPIHTRHRRRKRDTAAPAARIGWSAPWDRGEASAAEAWA